MNTKRVFSLLSFVALALPLRSADFEQAVTDLIPKLADANVPARYAAQMQLQDIASAASKPGNASDRATLGTVLAAKAADASVPQPARVWIVRQLEYMGGAEAVETLTKLLNADDAELRECARRALEKSPAPAASTALWNALQKVATDRDANAFRWKIGLIHSLGERRDTAAVGFIKPRLADVETAAAAAKALGQIANAAAVDALWAARDRNPWVDESLLDAASRLTKNGGKSDAADICRKLYAQGNIPASRAAALSILAKAEPAAARKLIDAALAATDTRLQKAAVDAAPDAFGAGFSDVLVRRFASLPSSAKVFALRAVDSSVERQAIGAATDADANVRVAALEAMGRIGSRASVPPLVKAATGDQPAEKSAAVASLARVNGTGASEAIASLAAQGDSKARVVAINALADRSVTAALPALLSYAAEPDAGISKAACAALGRMGTDKEIDGLVQLVLAGKAAGADDALQAVASRASDKSSAAKMLVAKAQAAQGQQLISILDVLSVLGGDDALVAVTKFTADFNPEVKDGAIRALCNWQELTAALPLLAIATDQQTSEGHHVLALRAVNRLVKSSDKDPAAVRLRIAQEALKAASRDQEKKLAISSIGTVPDRVAADMLLPMLKDEKLAKDAALALLNLADALRRGDRATARKLAQTVRAANLGDDINKRAESSLNRR